MIGSLDFQARIPDRALTCRCTLRIITVCYFGQSNQTASCKSNMDRLHQLKNSNLAVDDVNVDLESGSKSNMYYPIQF